MAEEEDVVEVIAGDGGFVGELRSWSQRVVEKSAIGSTSSHSYILILCLATTGISAIIITNVWNFRQKSIVQESRIRFNGVRRPGWTKDRSFLNDLNNRGRCYPMISIC